VRHTGGKKVNSKKPSSKKVQLWGGIIEYDAPTPSVQTERIHAAIDVGLGTFEQHKTTLITILRDAHDGRLKSEPFDEPKSWSCLTSLAHSFFWQARLKLETMPAANRKQRLDELARVLTRSRTIVDAAMQDDVGDDLFSSWCEGTNEPLVSLVRNDDGSLAPVRGPEKMFKKAVVSLAALETAAVHAAKQMRRPGRGRRKGTTVLPVGYIEALATLYRETTGSKPGTGSGPFVRFVYAFLAAVGVANISEGHVAELAQAARSWAHTHPSGWAPSPFDD
jgi:hypothetical protein